MKSSSVDNSTLNSWILAIAICFHFINGVVGIAGVSAATAAVIWVLSVVSLARGTYSVNAKHLVFFMLVLLVLIVSLLIMKDTTYVYEYLQYFLLFDVIALFAGQQQIDAGKTIALINYIGLAGLLVLMRRGVENERAGYEMGMSYAILGILFAAVIHIVLNLKYPLVPYANIAIALRLLAPIAPRGIWLSLIVFLFAVMFNVITKGQDRGRKLLLKMVVLVIMTVSGLLAVNNLDKIVAWLNQLLNQTLRLNIYAIEKYLYFLEIDNLSNGREALYSAVSEIIDGGSVVIGRGVGYLEAMLNVSYAHNILLQLACEFGIIVMGLFVYILLKSVWMVLFGRFDSPENFYLFVFLFGYGVIMLFYSSVHWCWIPFWIFLGKYFSLTRKGNQNERFYS